MPVGLLINVELNPGLGAGFGLNPGFWKVLPMKPGAGGFALKAEGAMLNWPGWDTGGKEL